MGTKERERSESKADPDRFPNEQQLTRAMTESFRILARQLSATVSANETRQLEQVIDHLRQNIRRTRSHRRGIYASLGRLLSEKETARRLRLPRQTLQGLIARRELIALPILGRGHEFPEAQFDDQHPSMLVNGLQEVLQALASAGPWSAAEFLVTRNPRLGDRPLQLLKQRKASVTAITKAAAIWARP